MLWNYLIIGICWEMSLWLILKNGYCVLDFGIVCWIIFLQLGEMQSTQELFSKPLERPKNLQ